MEPKKKPPATIDDDIAARPPEVQAILQRISLEVLDHAAEAEETISYRIPAFKLNGSLLYFAAFRNHIGMYRRTFQSVAL